MILGAGSVYGVMRSSATCSLILWAVAIISLGGCGSGNASTPPGVSPGSSPTSTLDRATRQFVSTVHTYWVDLIAADGNAPRVCLNGPIQPTECEARAQAQLVVQRTFLQYLQTTTPPPQFKAPDQALLMEIPKAINDLEAMVSAAQSGNKDAVAQATSVYVAEMEPGVTEALDAIDTSMVHIR